MTDQGAIESIARIWCVQKEPAKCENWREHMEKAQDAVDALTDDGWKVVRASMGGRVMRCPFCGSTDTCDTTNDQRVCLDCEQTWTAGGQRR